MRLNKEWGIESGLASLCAGYHSPLASPNLRFSIFHSPLVLLLLLLPIVVEAQPARNKAIAEYVKTLRNEKLLQNASMSIVVMDAKTRKVIASHNPQVALIPASTLKLVTTGVALRVLGSHYTFRTSLYYDGTIKDSTLSGNLYVVGGGDPTFGSDESIATPVDTVFSRWAAAIKQLGINRVAGHIVADESFLVNEETPESWTWGDMGNYYGTCATGLPFYENAYKVVLTPGRSEGDKAHVQTIYPYLPDTRFTNYVTTGKAQSANTAVIYNSHYSNQHVFKGSIPLNRDSVVAKGANKMPAYTCIHFFGEYLRHYNIRVDGMLHVVSEPQMADSTRKLIASHHSPSLKEIVAVTNRTSNNFYAEILLKTIGVVQRHRGTYEEATSAMFHLLDSLKIPHAGLKIVDGSGLSRKNYATARFLADFLYAMYHSKTFDDFDHSLAIPGEKGTMLGTIRKAPNKQRLHAKSGSMEGVRAYAGYSVQEDTTLIFAIIINNFTHRVATIQPKVEKLLELLTE